MRKPGIHKTYVTLGGIKRMRISIPQTQYDSLVALSNPAWGSWPKYWRAWLPVMNAYVKEHGLPLLHPENPEDNTLMGKTKGVRLALRHDKRELKFKKLKPHQEVTQLFNNLGKNQENTSTTLSFLGLGKAVGEHTVSKQPQTHNRTDEEEEGRAQPFLFTK